MWWTTFYFLPDGPINSQSDTVHNYSPLRSLEDVDYAWNSWIQRAFYLVERSTSLILMRFEWKRCFLVSNRGRCNDVVNFHVINWQNLRCAFFWFIFYCCFCNDQCCRTTFSLHDSTTYAGRPVANLEMFFILINLENCFEILKFRFCILKDV